MVNDIKSQVLLCLRDRQMYHRWGLHYILSLARAHQRQTCINFKDMGIQLYGRHPLYSKLAVTKWTACSTISHRQRG